MRSQDIVILLKIAAMKKSNWFAKDLAYDLGVSQSEVSESLNRSKIAGLLSADKKRLMKNNLLDFLVNGIQYVFPAEIGAIQRGMATAHSAPPLNHSILSEEVFVWPFANGTTRGQSIEPLHSGVPEACLKDEKLYEMLALVDSIRLGRNREKESAINILKDII